MGIEEFEKAERENELIIFEPDDCYYRKCFPDQANSWHLAIYAFPAGCVPPVRFKGQDAIMQYMPHPISGGVAGSILELKTIYLEAEKVYLGLHVERFVGHFPVTSGWSLSGPGNYNQYQSGYVLQAIYPRDAIPVTGCASLDRLQPTTEGPSQT